MRGEVLHYDETQGFGFITGADGNRYTFRREDLRRAFPVPKGAIVEFKESGGQARDIFPIRGESPFAAPAAAPSAAAAHPRQFGRLAVNPAPASTGLWGYF
jgi:cold shock CspA family protein